MISPEWVQMMSRYNLWQNNQLADSLKLIDQDDLDVDRGAFFGSIQSTLSHLLRGDLLWMSRLDAASPPSTVPPSESAQAFATKAAWLSERNLCDARIRVWADAVAPADLEGDLTWTYSFETRQVSKPMGWVITHFFNHQTHHRGQVHAMLTASGHPAPVSDLSYLPEDI